MLIQKFIFETLKYSMQKGEISKIQFAVRRCYRCKQMHVQLEGVVRALF